MPTVSFTPGISNALQFWVRLGVCVLATTMFFDASQIIAPTHISSSALSGVGMEARGSQWRVSMDSMGRYMDRLAVTSGVCWVRCDQPYPLGAGTSQVCVFSSTHADRRPP